MDSRLGRRLGLSGETRLGAVSFSVDRVGVL
jgi:hypothetical protein